MKPFEKGECTLGIFADLSKAFDTVNHNILLTKFHNNSIKGNYYELLKSFLTNRKQYVCFEQNEGTSFQSIFCRVLQGLILSLLFFLIYVNDLCTASSLYDLTYSVCR